MITPLSTLLDALDAVQVFVHNVTSVPNSAELAPILPGINRYPERALLLGREDDVVCVTHPVETAFVRFLNALGLGPDPENVLVIPTVPARSYDHAPPDCVTAPVGTVEEIADRIGTARHVVLNPFIATPREFALAAALERRLGRSVDVLGSDPPLVRRIYQKHLMRARAIELGVPMAEGEVVHLHRAADNGTCDLASLRLALERRLPATGRVIIRGTCGTSASATWVVRDDPVGIRHALNLLSHAKDNTAYLVDVMVNVIASPNIQMFIHPRDRTISCVGITDQLLSTRLTHEGNSFPSSAECVTEMVAAAAKMSAWLATQGYVGLLGLDFVEYRDPGSGKRAYFLAEINPRTNGAAYPVVLFERLNQRNRRHGRPPLVACLSQNLSTTMRSFTEIRDRYGDLFYHPDQGRGMLPYNTGCLEYGKFAAAFLGESLKQVRSMCADFKSRLH